MSATVLLEGVEQLRRALILTDADARKRMQGAIGRGTKRVTAGAKARVPKRTGELASTIRDEYAPDGLTGYVKAGYGVLVRSSRRATTSRSQANRARRMASLANNRLQLALANTSKQALSVLDLGIYSAVVEWGDKRRHHAAHHYLYPALDAATPGIKSDIAGALNGAIAEGGMAP